MMTREMLYDAITEVKDALVLEAIEAKPAKSRVRWLKFGSIAAAAALVIGLGAGVYSGKLPLPIGGSAGGIGHNGEGLPPPGGSEEGGGHGEGSSTFMSYAGPVFPLTTVEGGDGLTVERAITCDFEGWGNEYPYDLPVTDSYILTNPTGEDKTVTLLYPFAGELFTIGLGKQRPTLTADGTELQTALLTGQYSQLTVGRPGGLPSLSAPDSWEEYRERLSGGRYQAGALEDWPDLSHIPVTVYEITNPWVSEEAEAVSPHIFAEMELDYGKTTVLTHGFNTGMYDQDSGRVREGFSAPQPPAEGSSIDPAIYERDRAEIHYLIVIGDPLDSFQLVGVSIGEPDSTDYLEWGVDIGADLRQYETDLDSALRTVAEQMPKAKNYGVVDSPDFELYFGMLKDCLLDTGVLLDNPEERHSFTMLEDLYPDVIQRVFYLETEITVPAGGSVTVEAQMIKEASFDYACTGSKNKGVYGYDMVTRLDTSLEFTQQIAKAVNTVGVEIVRQNFGFDWANGINTVPLDPAEEHYYLEVRRAEET